MSNGGSAQSQAMANAITPVIAEQRMGVELSRMSLPPGSNGAPMEANERQSDPLLDVYWSVIKVPIGITKAFVTDPMRSVMQKNVARSPRLNLTGRGQTTELFKS